MVFRGDPRRRAVRACDRGAQLLDLDDVQAERHYRTAIDLDPTLAVAWFDLGLLYKRRADWPQSLECNRRAAEQRNGSRDLADGGDPAFWNAGIAATALHDWPSARWAWRGYGITAADDEGEGPIDIGRPMGVTRLPDGETVWTRRLDPARMVLTSVPLPDSGFRCGDIVLNDGQPLGSRVVGGHEYSVLNTLERWEASPVPTQQIDVIADEDAVTRLLDVLIEHGTTAENWTTSITVNCAACSHGRLDYDHPDHAHGANALGADGATRIGCSGDHELVSQVTAAWAAATAATIVGVHEVA